jgi:hypothetical protein
VDGGRQPLPNRYRRIFLGLANDELDEDGEPLEPGAQELPRAATAFRRRCRAARALRQGRGSTPCHDRRAPTRSTPSRPVDRTSAPADLKKDERRSRDPEEVEKARKKAHLATLDELAEKQPRCAEGEDARAARRPRSRRWRPSSAASPCEGLLGRQGVKHTDGIYDDAMRLAVRKFQQKHMIYEANYLRRKTVDALARPLIDNDYDDLTRALRERVVAARDPRGRVGVEGRNLVDEYLKVALEQMQLSDGRGGARVLQAAIPPPSSSGCASRSSCPRGPTTTPTTWTCRSSSIAATSGTTCRSRRRPLQAAAAQEVPVADGVRQGRRQADRAGALAARPSAAGARSRRRTATNTSATSSRTSGRA